MNSTFNFSELWSWPTHTTTQVERSVSSRDRVETNGRTDEYYRLLYLPGEHSR